jgi:hypothetical protein
MMNDESAVHYFEEISNLMKTGLNRKQLEPILTLLRTGIHPDAISVLIMELRREIENSSSESQKEV